MIITEANLDRLLAAINSLDRSLWAIGFVLVIIAIIIAFKSWTR